MLLWGGVLELRRVAVGGCGEEGGLGELSLQAGGTRAITASRSGVPADAPVAAGKKFKNTRFSENDVYVEYSWTCRRSCRPTDSSELLGFLWLPRRGLQRCEVRAEVSLVPSGGQIRAMLRRVAGPFHSKILREFRSLRQSRRGLDDASLRGLRGLGRSCLMDRVGHQETVLSNT